MKKIVHIEKGIMYIDAYRYKWKKTKHVKIHAYIDVCAFFRQAIKREGKNMTFFLFQNKQKHIIMRICPKEKHLI